MERIGGLRYRAPSTDTFFIFVIVVQECDGEKNIYAYDENSGMPSWDFYSNVPTHPGNVLYVDYPIIPVSTTKLLKKKYKVGPSNDEGTIQLLEVLSRIDTTLEKEEVYPFKRYHTFYKAN